MAAGDAMGRGGEEVRMNLSEILGGILVLLGAVGVMVEGRPRDVHVVCDCAIPYNIHCKV